MSRFVNADLRTQLLKVLLENQLISGMIRTRRHELPMTELTQPPPYKNPPRRSWVYDALLVLVILAGLYLRISGTAWDEGQYLHPDERFLMFVESSIQPVKGLGEYFNTAVSTLNPNNVGHPFFVYGTWPIFFVRYLLEWLGKSGGEVFQLGRPLSAVFSTATILLVYLIGSRLYDRRVALLAAAFSAFSVLDIQLSHFFKEDTFMTFFAILALYYAVRVATGSQNGQQDQMPAPETGLARAELDNRSEKVLASQAPAAAGAGYFRKEAVFFPLFGLALGMAMASKINSFPMALALPVAVLIRVYGLPSRKQTSALVEGLGYLVLGGLASFLTFRILQPYAFSGPGFFGLLPNPKWLDNLRELQRLTSPDSIYGFPPALQWADRPVWFAWVNITRWGLGLPLGLLAWAGFTWVGWRTIRGEWPRHILIWGWTAVYFTWQSLVLNPTMRYQLPVYPTLVLLAAWAAVALWDWAGRRPSTGIPEGPDWKRGVVLFVVGGVIAATIIWAWAFSSIYRHPVTRIAASRWIYQNIPGAITLQIEEPNQGSLNQPLPYPYDSPLRPDLPYNTFFSARADGQLSQVTLPRVSETGPPPGAGVFTLTVLSGENPNSVLGRATAAVSAAGTATGAAQAVRFAFPLQYRWLQKKPTSCS